MDTIMLPPSSSSEETTKTSVPTNEEDLLLKYENPEVGQAIKVGHLYYEIKIKHRSLRSVVKWATDHNKQGRFPPVVLSQVVMIKSRFVKFSHEKIAKEQLYEEFVHCFGAPKKQTLCSEKCESCQGKTEQNRNLTEENGHLMQKAEKLEKQVQRLKKQNSNLKRKLNEPPKKEKVSLVQIRKLYYLCLLKNIPSLHIPPLVKSLLDLVNLQGSVFSRTSAHRMIGELGFISDVLTMQAVLDSSDVTLIFDVTTQRNVHVNCILLCTSENTYVVNIEQLPGGTSLDYSDHILNSLKNLAKVYSTAYSKSFDEIFKKLKSKLSCVLTDRTTVNHATVSLLELTLDKSLVELNCNVHPLQAITKSIMKYVQFKESEHTQKISGNKSCLIHSVISKLSTLRYKDSNGSFKDFKTALRAMGKNIIIARIPENRIDIVFHQSFVCFLNYETILKVLKSLNSDSARNLMQEFENEELITELQVFAILDKIFSGPWMSTFYAPLHEQHSIKEGIDLVRKVLSRVEHQLRDPLGVLNCTCDFFGNRLELDDESRNMLFRFPSNHELFRSMIEASLHAVTDVLVRQYDRQFKCYNDLTEGALTSARQHTMEIESVIREFSARKKIASFNVLSISNLIKSKRNRILDSLHDEGVDKLIKLAMKHSRSEIRRNIENKKSFLSDGKKKARIETTTGGGGEEGEEGEEEEK